MSLWARRGVSQTVGAWLSDEDDMPWAMGGAGSDEVALDLNENEMQRERRLRRERLARKVQPGFTAAWRTE